MRPRLANVLNVRFARIPSRIEAEEITLQLLRWKDLAELLDLFRSHPFLPPRQQDAPPASRWSLKQRLRRAFQVLYLIKQNVGGKRRIKGFAGLYDVRLKESVFLSVAIFDPRDRGHGLGSKALRALLHALQKRAFAARFQARVAPVNLPSIRLFSQLGFDIYDCSEGSLLMTKRVPER